MNLYILNECPIKAAQLLNNKHLIKMTYDVAQILSTTIMMNSTDKFSQIKYCEVSTMKVKWMYYNKDLRVPSPIRVNHPIVIWTEKTQANYSWTFRFFKEILKQYEIKFNKQHHYNYLIKYFSTGSELLEYGKLTKFINCAGNEKYDFRDLPNAILAYRMLLEETND